MASNQIRSMLAQAVPNLEFSGGYGSNAMADIGRLHVFASSDCAYGYRTERYQWCTKLTITIYPEDKGLRPKKVWLKSYRSTREEAEAAAAKKWKRFAVKFLLENAL